jgi:protein-arginine deiminase
MVIAKPFGPKDSSGKDVFEEDFKTKITTLTEVPIDDWTGYHSGWGEVHCGTNVKRTPPSPSTDWWE